MTDRTKYLHRPYPGTLLFRYRHQTLARLPIDETSAKFAAAYDSLLAEVLAGRHGEKPGKLGRPPGKVERSLSKHKQIRVRPQVYFIGCGNFVKIGFAKAIRKRQSRLQTGSPQTLRLLGCAPGSSDVEQFLHWQFRRYRDRGEWFRIEGALASFLHEQFNVRCDDGQSSDTDRGGGPPSDHDAAA